MLFSDGACSRRVSLFRAVLFSAKMRKAQEREKDLGVGKERENFVFVFVGVLFCVECRGREERGKRNSSFLDNVGNEEETSFMKFFQFFFQFFFYAPRTRLEVVMDRILRRLFELYPNLVRGGVGLPNRS